MTTRNLFTTSDAELMAHIMMAIEKNRSVLVMADRDADLLIWRKGEGAGERQRNAHPEQFIGHLLMLGGEGMKAEFRSEEMVHLPGIVLITRDETEW